MTIRNYNSLQRVEVSDCIYQLAVVERLASMTSLPDSIRRYLNASPTLSRKMTLGQHLVSRCIAHVWTIEMYANAAQKNKQML